MQCLEKQKLNEIDKNTLHSLRAKGLDKEANNLVREAFDKIAKPVDGLGVFEDTIARIGAIQGDSNVSIKKRAHLIMCSDNGIVEEGVSQSSREVTLKVAKNMLKGKSSAAVMAKEMHADMYVYDVGMDTDEKPDGLIDKKIRRSSRNFLKEEAMSEKETLDAILTGINISYEMCEKGYELLTLGEMGIGNTTTSSAICASLLHLDAKSVTGRGAGLSDEGLIKKTEVIDRAIQRYDLYKKDAFTVLQSVGGYDIATLAGVCIGGAFYGIPVVLDGVITQAAALVACKIFSEVKDYIFASHKGKEAASSIILNEMNLHPVIDANMALGEGTGALMYVSLLDMAMSVYDNAAKFDELLMDEYERYN
ncbi:MAG: nicotinate-nucleotide--dimethylbenzimidazole phosphoribosyltransferase [Lachnospiraceae bacterium]|nr:nicotinate-nucleotide--dimethylbenzimidazole phosphoribosyltransferase [Lachnospiraceae bacterium]